MSTIVHTSAETAIVPLSAESTRVTSALDDLFGSLLASRAHLLTTLSASDELTQERFREQSAQLAELISDFGNIHRALIVERECYCDLKAGHEGKVRSFTQIIRAISLKVTAINQGIATQLGDAEVESIAADVPIEDMQKESVSLAVAVDKLSFQLVKVSKKIDEEAVKFIAVKSQVEILKAQLAAAKLQTQSLKESHAAEIAGLSTSTEARIRAEDKSWEDAFNAYVKTSGYYRNKYRHLEKK